MNNYIKIKGNSSFTIFVNNNFNLEKKSNNDEDWCRLVKSIDKQQNFYNNKYIIVPKIYKCLKEEKKIEMEFIKNGVNIIDFFLLSNKKDITNFCNNIFKFIEINIQKSQEKEIECKIFIEKINSIHDSMLKNEVLNLNDKSKMKNMFDNVKNILYKLKTITLPIGLNHGDLTFSNMMICNKNIILFDFLDSYIESPMNDIIKLHQDCLFDWTTKFYYRNFDITKIKIINRYIYLLSVNFFKKYEWYNKYSNILLLINFFRIIPYVKEEGIKNDVINNCIHLTNYL